MKIQDERNQLLTTNLWLNLVNIQIDVECRYLHQHSVDNNHLQHL